MRRRKELTNEQFENMGFLVLITVLALLCRFLLFPFESGDYHQFL